VARVRYSFTMDMAPEQAQALFVRDLVPDLHKDAGFVLVEERAGALGFSKGVLGGAAFNPEETTDPDVTGHAEEIEEPDLKLAAPREPTTIFPRGVSRVGTPGAAVQSDVRRWISRRLDVEFAAEGAGTRVTLKGHAGRDLRDALGRLGTAGHWPATAKDPHD